MTIIERIRRTIEEELFILSDHTVWDKMRPLELETEDLLHAIFNGWIDRKLTNDPRGTRYCFVGPTMDGERYILKSDG